MILLDSIAGAWFKAGIRQIASLAGLAPFPRESGQRKGYRAIRGGRAEVRNALFNAARVGIRFNPKPKVFAERLAATSKPYKTK